MANEDEKDESGAGFVMGLLTGTVLGAGLGMLLAPKTGAERYGSQEAPGESRPGSLNEPTTSGGRPGGARRETMKV